MLVFLTGAALVMTAVVSAVVQKTVLLTVDGIY
jgi:hypothetical protein